MEYRTASERMREGGKSGCMEARGERGVCHKKIDGVERSLTPGNGRGHPHTSPAAENIRGNSQTNYVHEEISCTVKTMKCWSVAGREWQKVGTFSKENPAAAS